jgi:hypothetical protein
MLNIGWQIADIARHFGVTKKEKKRRGCGDKGNVS